NVVPGLDDDLRENVLGAAPLVRGDQLRIAVDVADGLLEVVEVSRAGIRLVAHHHPGPLAIAHRARARIGEQVDVDVLGLDEERVETGLADVTLALRACGHVNRLDDLDLPGLGPAAMAHSSILPARSTPDLVRNREGCVRRDCRGIRTPPAACKEIPSYMSGIDPQMMASTIDRIQIDEHPSPRPGDSGHVLELQARAEVHPAARVNAATRASHGGRDAPGGMAETAGGTHRHEA